MSILVVDALASGSIGKRVVTVDVIGAGPRTVVGVLEGQGLDADLYTIDKVMTDRNILRSYKVLMISAMSIDEASVAKLVRSWRRFNPRSLVILGGPITSDPESIIRVNADIGIHGESEPVLEKLAKIIDLDKGIIDYDEVKNICGTIYKYNGSIKINQRCPIMTRREWEKYRPSTRVITSYPIYWAARVYVETVRGCSNYTFPSLEDLIPVEYLPSKPRPGCAYCSVIHLWGYARSRSISLVYDEIKKLIDEGARRIVLSGPDFLDYGRDWLIEPKPLVNPFTPPPNTRAIEELLHRLYSIPEVSSGEAKIMVENVKPNLVTEEAARVLGKYLKGTPVHLGAETGDDNLLKALGRPAFTSDVFRAIRLLKKYGLRPYVYIMYCLPGETPRSVQKTLRYMEKIYKLGAEKITAYKFTPLPGSYLEKIPASALPCKKGVHPVKAKAIELNKRSKKKMIGKVLRFIIVDYSKRYKGYIAYPLAHGPVTVIKTGSEEKRISKRCIVDARVTSIINDRVVKAYLTRIVRCKQGGIEAP